MKLLALAEGGREAVGAGIVCSLVEVGALAKEKKASVVGLVIAPAKDEGRLCAVVVAHKER